MRRWQLLRALPLLVVVCVGLGVVPSLGAEVLDHGLYRSMPPLQSIQEILRDGGTCYSLITLGPVDGTHELTWKWIAPDGATWREDGPIGIGSPDQTFPAIPVGQSFTVGNELPTGEWQLQIQLDHEPLLTESFNVVVETELGDYGDAPDGSPCGYSDDPDHDVIGRFPTRLDTANTRVAGQQGAHALQATEIALGNPEIVSLELGANDPSDPDQTPNLVDSDIDDGLALELLPNGGLQFCARVVRSASSPAGACYLNVLYDINRDGEWRQSGFGAEWIVVNRELLVAPGEERVVVLPVPLDQDWSETLSLPRWMRIAVTDSPIPEAPFADVGGWDGSGRFASGEIEDHRIGAIRAEDVDHAVRSATRVAWAHAQANARALSWSLAASFQHIAQLSVDRDRAADAAYSAQSAHDRAASHAFDADFAYTEVTAAADAAAFAYASTPCATVAAYAAASAEASVQAAASAVAWAQASATATAEAYALALSWSAAGASAYAEAQAAALSFSLSYAEAHASANALAESSARARAWSEARAAVLGADLDCADAEAHARAWANAYASARAQASVHASVQVATFALSYVQTVVEASTVARAAADAAAFAAAQADASAQATANASAIVRASGTAISESMAAVSVSTTQDCCEQILPCPPQQDCPPCPIVICPECNSCCPSCPTCPGCDSCCDSCPPCPECATCPSCSSCCPTCPGCASCCPTCPACPECPSCEELWGTPTTIAEAADNLATFAGDRARSTRSWRWSVSENDPFEACTSCGGAPMCYSCMEFDLYDLLTNYCCLSSSLEQDLQDVLGYLSRASTRDREALAAVYWQARWDAYNNR